MFASMHKLIQRKPLATYPVLMVLILQLGLTSLLCAVSPYQAEASTLTICTSFGLKTITLDKNGEPIEQQNKHEVQQTCFHCASGGCGMAALTHSETELFRDQKEFAQQANYQIVFINAENPRPPTRAPPASV